MKDLFLAALFLAMLFGPSLSALKSLEDKTPLNPSPSTSPLSDNPIV